MRELLDIHVLVIVAVLTGYLLVIIVLTALSAEPAHLLPSPLPPHTNGAAR